MHSDPDFDVETVPFRWLPPEVTNPTRGGTVPVESKPADIFAFGMLAAGLFAGDTPSGERSEVALRRVSQGSRLEKPEGAEALGLTPQMWELLESCTRQDPKQRPKIQDAAKKWERFVGSGVVFKYVQRFRLAGLHIWFYSHIPVVEIENKIRRNGEEANADSERSLSTRRRRIKMCQMVPNLGPERSLSTYN